MFGILLSALNAALTWIFQKFVIKFVVLFAVFFVVEALASVLGGFLPQVSSLNGVFSSIPSGIWFFMDLFAFSDGASIVMTAMVYRFLIRRMPVIG